MKRDAQRTWRAVAAAAAVAVLGTLSTAAMAEEAIVKMPAASVLSAKTARSTKLASLKTGDKLQVLAHEGSWLKVTFGGKEGYVHENTVGGGGDNSLSKALGKASGSSASEASGKLAGKGVGEGAIGVGQEPQHEHGRPGQDDRDAQLDRRRRPAEVRRGPEVSKESVPCGCRTQCVEGRRRSSGAMAVGGLLLLPMLAGCGGSGGSSNSASNIASGVFSSLGSGLGGGSGSELPARAPARGHAFGSMIGGKTGQYFDLGSQADWRRPP